MVRRGCDPGAWAGNSGRGGVSRRACWEVTAAVDTTNHDCFPRAVTSAIPRPTTCRPAKAAVPIRLTRGERQVLRSSGCPGSGRAARVLRVRVVLAAAAKVPNAVIAAHLGVTVDTVRTWRARFAVGGLEGLLDQPRSGWPRVCAPVVFAQVKAIVCSSEQGLPFSAWTCTEIAQEAVERGVIGSLSSPGRRRDQALASSRGRDSLTPEKFRA